MWEDRPVDQSQTSQASVRMCQAAAGWLCQCKTALHNDQKSHSRGRVPLRTGCDQLEVSCCWHEKSEKHLLHFSYGTKCWWPALCDVTRGTPILVGQGQQTQLDINAIFKLLLRVVKHVVGGATKYNNFLQQTRLKLGGCESRDKCVTIWRGIVFFLFLNHQGRLLQKKKIGRIWIHLTEQRPFN